MSDGVDRRLVYAIALSGITLALAVGNAVQDPGLITGTIAAGLAVVFLGLSLGELPRRVEA